MNDPIGDKITVTGLARLGVASFEAKINVRLLEPAAAGGSIEVRVAAGYEEIVVYTTVVTGLGAMQTAPADECLYLYDRAVATLPAPASGQGYIAVDLSGVREHQYFVDGRALVAQYVKLFKAGGAHPGGTGPVSSHP